MRWIIIYPNCTCEYEESFNCHVSAPKHLCAEFPLNPHIVISEENPWGWTLRSKKHEWKCIYLHHTWFTIAVSYLSVSIHSQSLCGFFPFPGVSLQVAANQLKGACQNASQSLNTPKHQSLNFAPPPLSSCLAAYPSVQGSVMKPWKNLRNFSHFSRCLVDGYVNISGMTMQYEDVSWCSAGREDKKIWSWWFPCPIQSSGCYIVLLQKQHRHLR